MIETSANLVTMAYNLLRDPSQAKLPYETMRLLLNLLMRGYVQDMQLGERDQRTDTKDVTLTQADIDYVLTMENIPDFEAQMLEYSPGTNANWYEVKLVPFDSWPQHFDQPLPVACVYGSLAIQNGVKIKLNMTDDAISNSSFRLSYRMPLLTVLQMGDSPPLPGQFVPMVAYDLAVRGISACKDDTDAWKDWVKRTEPKYIAYIADERRRWADYLDTRVEPQVQDLRPFNSHRQGGGSQSRSTRGYVPLQP